MNIPENMHTYTHTHKTKQKISSDFFLFQVNFAMKIYEDSQMLESSE